ncbi:ribonuclease H-like domain-containing protein [Tanacetum coccineum]
MLLDIGRITILDGRMLSYMVIFLSYYMHQPPGFRDSGHPDYVLFLSQKKYAIEILEKAHMVYCNPSRTPVDTESKLGLMVIRYLIRLCIRVLQGTLNYGLQLFSSSTTDLVAYLMRMELVVHDRRSTLGYCVFLGNNLLSWSAKRQPTLSRSSAQAEYRGVVNVVVETCWLRNLLQSTYDGIIEIDIHFVRDLVALVRYEFIHVPSRYQYADIFTKGLPSALFEEFRTSLSVRCPPAPTAGEC